MSRDDLSDDGTLDLSFSSESPVRDFFGPPVVLLHEEKSVDLSRLNSVLFNHDPNQILGPVVESRIDKDDRKGRATIRFDDDDFAQTARDKVRSGSLRGVSVSYSATKAQRIDEGEEWKSPGGRSFEGPLLVATRWEPIELSLTPIPADSAVGVGRTQAEGDDAMVLTAELRAALIGRGMPEGATDDEALGWLNDHPEALGDANTETTRAAATTTAADDQGTTTTAGEGNTESARDAVLGERRRQTELREIARQANIPDDRLAVWLSGDVTPDAARKEALSHWAAANPPVGQTRTVDVGEDAISRLNRAALAGLNSRLGQELEKDAPNDAPESFSLRQYVRERLVLAGIQMARTAPFPSVATVFYSGTRDVHHATDDFDSLLQNVANKDLRRGYTEAPTTYQTWTRRRELTNFQQHSTVNFGQAQVYLEKPELMPITEQTITDARENYTLVTYANKFSLSREALINDDLGGFSRIAQLLGAAGARTINQATYDHLNSNPTMTEDSIALFATTHASGDNTAASAGAPSAANLAEGRQKMRLQTGLGTGAPTLNLIPRWILVPAEYEAEADQLLNGMYTPTATATAITPSMRSLEIIVEPYLDGLDSTGWYMIADSALVDTVIVGRLAGQNAPVIQRVEDTTVLGSTWVAYIDAVARAVDHRGLFRNT